MKWLKKLIQKIKGLFKRNKNVEKSQHAYSEKTLKERIIKYKLVDLNTIEDKDSYECVVTHLRNEAKKLFSLNYYKNLGLRLWEISEQANHALLIIIMGEFKTGKSTFINTILGEEVLKSDVTPATAVVTMLSYGDARRILVHFKDGTELDYSVEELATLTAEDDTDKGTLRDSIKYVELFLPHPLLKQLTIVDTPGLNVDNSKHIEATKEFMNTADLVLWVFAAGRAASRTEIAAIKDLSQRLKPTAIINRIDEIDQEEESIEDVIEEIKSRLKDVVKDVIGISAFLAKQGQMTSDEKLIKESNWYEFKTKFENDIVSKSEELKMKATLDKVKEFMILLKREYANKDKKFKELDDKVNHKKEYEANARGVLHKVTNAAEKLTKYLQDKPIGAISSVSLEDAMEKCEEYIYRRMYEPIDLLRCVREFIDIFAKEEVYRNRIETYEDMIKKVVNDFERLESQRNTIREADKKLIEQVKSWRIELSVYNTSGIFGGRPIFDFTGEGSKLNNRQKELQKEEERIKVCWGTWGRSRAAICSELVRFNLEIYKFLEEDILKDMHIIKKEMKKELANMDKETQRTEELYEQYKQDQIYIVDIIEKLEVYAS